MGKTSGKSRKVNSRGDHNWGIYIFEWEIYEWTVELDKEERNSFWHVSRRGSSLEICILEA